MPTTTTPTTPLIQGSGKPQTRSLGPGVVQEVTSTPYSEQLQSAWCIQQELSASTSCPPALATRMPGSQSLQEACRSPAGPGALGCASRTNPKYRPSSSVTSPQSHCLLLPTGRLQASTRHRESWHLGFTRSPTPPAGRTGGRRAEPASTLGLQPGKVQGPSALAGHGVSLSVL